MEEQSKPKISIYYDGSCNLCSGLTDRIDLSEHGSAFTLTDISKGRLPVGVSKEEAMHDVHVVDQNGRMYRGVDAVLRILEEYPRLRWLAVIGSFPGFRQLFMFMYRIVERTRYSIFGRKKIRSLQFLHEGFIWILSQKNV